MKFAAALVAATMLVAAPAAAQDEQQEARVEIFRKLPHWPGYWVGETASGIDISGMLQVGATRPEGTAEGGIALWDNKAPWNDEGKRRVAEVLSGQGARKGLGWGFPLMMASSTPLLFLITPEETIIVNAYRETRHIYTDGRPMPPAEDLWPTVTGTSIGRWEDDTLVIDTTMVSEPNVFFQGNVPLSDQARYHERIRLDGDKLVAEWTVEDPVTLSAPWKAKVNLIREPGFDRMIEVNWDNDPTGNEGDVNTIEPPVDEEQGQ